jgi:glyceraldehyde-3-phosphate dehydrogenase (NADP+)
VTTKDGAPCLFPDEAAIPAGLKAGLPLEQRTYLIDGDVRVWSGPVHEVLSPVCVRESAGLVQRRIGSYPAMSEKESLAALDAAVRAYDNGMGPWPTMSVEQRIRHVEDFVVRMKARRDDVVNLVMWEIGKTRKDSEKEFDRTVDYIVGTIEAVKDLDRASSRFVIEDGIIGQIRRAPLGVVLCTGPYNYPLNETFTMLLPALIMGNTVVFKPPKLGVLLHSPLLQAFRDSFPKGVVNTVYGDGSVIISPLMASGKIDVLAFIGSSRVADVLKKQHPKPHRLRSVLGLDAKNAAIVMADAEIDQAVNECVLGSLSFNGQRCTALKMIFVHQAIAGDFVDRFCRTVDTLKAGMPWDAGVDLTPLPVAGKPAYLTDLVDDARSHGARVVNAGGGSAEATFFHPAVLFPITHEMRIYREEQFGPVVPIAAFDDLSTPMRYVVESTYGQQVAVFGKDPNAIAKLVDMLVNQVCRVNVNSQCQRGPDSFPFTGRKDSAEGTLSVSDALRVFSIRTLVAAKKTSLNEAIITAITRERKSNFLSTDFIF